VKSRRSSTMPPRAGSYSYLLRDPVGISTRTMSSSLSTARDYSRRRARLPRACQDGAPALPDEGFFRRTPKPARALCVRRRFPIRPIAKAASGRGSKTSRTVTEPNSRRAARRRSPSNPRAPTPPRARVIRGGLRSVDELSSASVSTSPAPVCATGSSGLACPETLI
jgi:hypothetical protein